MTILSVLLLTLALTIFFISTREVILSIRRNLHRAKFRESRNALFGINPKKGRVPTHSTVSIREQRLAWLLAQNRDIVTERIKDYAVAQGVDNRGLYIDTFSLRHSLHSNSHFVSRILEQIKRGAIPAFLSAAQIMKRTSKMALLAIRSLPKLINLHLRKLRSIVKLRSNIKGEIDSGKNNSIR